MRKERKQKRYFAVVGAQRCGTTFLYKMLAQHPEIKMNKTVKPEPKFFLKSNFDEFSFDEYLSLNFDLLEDDDLIFGEKSTSYLEYGKIAKRIKSFVPHAKILIILRNPVDRAISNYAFSRANGLEFRKPEQAIALENENVLDFPDTLSVSPYAYVSRGIYVNYIEIYKKIFNKRLKVVVFEDLVSDPSIIQSIYEFLECGVSYLPKNFTLAENTAPDVDVPKNVRSMLAEFYKPHNRALEEMLKMSFEKWK